MQRTERGIPVLSWCIIARNAEATLEATLKSIRERTPDAEIVVVDTCSSDRTPEIAQRYADVFEVYKGPNGDWDTEMPWFSDAAAARQRSFEIAHGKFRGWIDADDRLAGPEEAKKLLQLNKQWQPPNPHGKVSGNGDAPPIGIEDILLMVEEKRPEADCFWAPYLYQRDENGHAMVWQERERIVKWDPKRWRWAEKAHEILVPNGPFPPRVVLSHLLFVHEKKFTKDDYVYSLSRHYDILKKQWDAGEKTTRRATYLADYAKVVDPAREEEYIEAAHTCSTNTIDRYRALMMRGTFYAQRGLLNDARESFGAATSLHPELPDAWFSAANCWAKANDVVRAVEWYEKGLACPPHNPNSTMSPRAISMEFPTRLAVECHKLGKALAGPGIERHEAALEYFGKAVDLMNKVANDPDIGTDAQEAKVRLIRFNNDLKAQKHAMMLREQANYLFDNDEPLKVCDLIRTVPWNLQDHPIVIELERRIAPVVRHVSDQNAYHDFYASNNETGAVESPELWLDPKTCVSRAKWIGEWLNLHMPNARVLEIGPFDGIVGIPLLRMCPTIQYVGLDIMQEAVDRLQERAKTYGIADRAKFIQGSISDEGNENLLQELGQFDAVIWCEVIEHVPSPIFDLRFIGRFLRDKNSRIFMTTPWGAFDAGHPPPANAYGHARDPRGHVRAFTTRDVIETVEAARLQTINLFKEAVPVTHTGDGLNAELALTTEWERYHSNGRVSFVVPGALWNWNSRTVHRDGMGASEETIVYLAKRLANERTADDSAARFSPVEVFGPVPDGEADVHERVTYWPKEQLRKLANEKSTIVVSRGPLFGRHIDEQILAHWGAKANEETKKALRAQFPKILWLQDAIYPELNAEVAEEYEKVVVVSRWHKEAMNQRHGVPLDKMVVAYNFLLPEHFEFADGPMAPGEVRPKRKNDHFIYASSPDRGIVQLLQAWPEILKALPDATLDIYYGWRGCEVLGKGNGSDQWVARFESHRKAFEALKHQKGVNQIGMVDHVTLAKAYSRAGVWAYWNPFEEAGCLSACKARAGGAIPVVAPIAALNETAKCDQALFVPLGNQKAFVEACVEATKVSEIERRKMKEQAISEYSLDKILPVWLDVLGARR